MQCLWWIEQHLISTVCRWYNSDDAGGTFFEWCDLDEAGQHPVAQPQGHGCTSGTATDGGKKPRTRKIGNPNSALIPSRKERREKSKLLLEDNFHVVYFGLNRREYKTKYGKEILQSYHIAIRSDQNKIIIISINQGGPNHSASVVSFFSNFLHHYIHPYSDPSSSTASIFCHISQQNIETTKPKKKSQQTHTNVHSIKSSVEIRRSSKITPGSPQSQITQICTPSSPNLHSSQSSIETPRTQRTLLPIWILFFSLQSLPRSATWRKFSQRWTKEIGQGFRETRQWVEGVCGKFKNPEQEQWEEWWTIWNWLAIMEKDVKKNPRIGISALNSKPNHWSH